MLAGCALGAHVPASFGGHRPECGWRVRCLSQTSASAVAVGPISPCATACTHAPLAPAPPPLPARLNHVHPLTLQVKHRARFPMFRHVMWHAAMAYNRALRTAAGRAGRGGPPGPALCPVHSGMLPARPRMHWPWLPLCCCIRPPHAAPAPAPHACRPVRDCCLLPICLSAAGTCHMIAMLRPCPPAGMPLTKRPRPAGSRDAHGGVLGGGGGNATPVATATLSMSQLLHDNAAPQPQRRPQVSPARAVCSVQRAHMRPCAGPASSSAHPCVRARVPPVCGVQQGCGGAWGLRVLRFLCTRACWSRPSLGQLALTPGILFAACCCFLPRHSPRTA